MSARLNIGTVLVELLMDDKLSPKAKQAEKNLNSFASGISELASRLDGLLTAAFKRAAMAAGAVATAAAVVGASFESQMSRVAAISGASTEGLAALTAEARRIGSETAFSATQAAQGMEALAQAGFTVEQIIAATSDAMALAGATGLELAEATDLVAATITQFGLAASDAGKVADVLAAGSQASLFSINDLAVAMRYGGSVGKAFGKSLEETVAAMAQFKNIGLTGEQAGTNFRAMMEALGNPTKTAREQIQALGLTLEDLDPKLKSFDEIMLTLAKSGMGVAESFAIFGTVAGANIAQLAQAAKEGKSSFVSMVDTLENSAGTADRTFAAMANNVAGRFEQLKSAVEDLLLELFESMRGPLTNLINGLMDRVSVLTGVVKKDGKEIESSLNSLVERILALTDRVILLIPFMEELAALMFAALVGAKGVIWLTELAKLATAFGITSVAALKQAASAAYAFGVALASSTAGITAIVTAVGLLAQAMAKLATETSEAADEQERLNAALEAKKQLTKETNAEEARLGALLEKTKENARFVLKNFTDLTAAERAHFEGILRMNAAEAARQVQQGELIEQGGQLIRVTEGNVELLNEQLSVSEKASAELQGMVRWTTELAAGMEAGTVSQNKWSAHAKALSMATGENIETLGDLLRVRDIYIGRLERETKLQDGLKNKIALVVAGMKAQGKETGEVEKGLGRTAKTERELNEEQEEAARLAKALADKFKAQKEAAEDMAASGKPIRQATLAYNRQLETIEEWKAAGIDQQLILEAQEAAWRNYHDALTAADRALEQTLKPLADAEAQMQVLGEQLQDMAAQWEVWAKQASAPSEILMGLIPGLDMVRSKVQEFFADLDKNQDSAIQFAEVIGSIGEAFLHVGMLALKAGQQIIDLFFGPAISAIKSQIQGLFDLFGMASEAWAMTQEQFANVKNKPTGQLMQNALAGNAATLMQEKISEFLKIITALHLAAPALIQELIRGLPLIFTALAKGAPKMLKMLALALPELLRIGVDAFVLSLQQSPKLLKAYLGIVTALMFALVDGADDIMAAWIGALPGLIKAIITFIPEIIYFFTLFGPELGLAIILGMVAAIPVFVEEMTKGLERLVKQVAQKFVEIFSFGLLGGSGGKGEKNDEKGMLESAWQGVKDAWSGIFGKRKGRHASGIPWVPHTMVSVLEPGEAVIDALSNWERLRTNLAAPGPIPQGASGGGAAGVAGVGGILEVLVAFDGQVVDAAQARSMEAGKMPQLRRAMRGTNTKIGFNRGRGSAWAYP